MIDIYLQTDYRRIISELLDYKRGCGATLTNKKLSEAMGVQPSYFSRFIQGNAHINADQLFLCCQALELSDEETQFLLLLQDLDRCSIPSRKTALKRQIDLIRRSRRDTSKHLRAEFIEPKDHRGLGEYYLDPLVPLVHTFLSLREYQISPHLICSCLGLSEARLKEILLLLTNLGIVSFSKRHGSYRLVKDHMHLHKGSSLNRAYQALFRQLALEHLRRTEESEKYEFSVTFSADEETRFKIHDEFNRFIKRAEELVRAAPSEGVFQLNFDLFRWDTRKQLKPLRKERSGESREASV